MCTGVNTACLIYSSSTVSWLALHNGWAVDIAYFDFSKTSDQVSFSTLVAKLVRCELYYMG